MSLDPVLKNFLAFLAEFPPIHTLSVEKVRKRMRTATRIKRVIPMTLVEDMSLPLPGRQIQIRHYRPTQEAVLPALIFFHGGGWVTGDLDTHDDICRRIAQQIGCAVIAVNYRLAPEHQFPAGLHDAYDAACYLYQHADRFGLDRSHLAIGGDSAGANLALAACLRLRDQGGASFIFQWLLYPSVDLASVNTESYRLRSDGYGLSYDDVLWFTRHYLAKTTSITDAGVSPLRAESFKGLPPAYVGIAEYDVLRDEAFALIDRFHQEGVGVVSDCFSDQIHGFANYAPHLQSSAKALTVAIEHLRTGLQG